MPWPIVMILVCIDSGDPYLYYGSKHHHFMGVNIKIQGWFQHFVTKDGSGIGKGLSLYRFNIMNP